MAGAYLSEQRLRTITKRQEKPAWGAKYQPAIRATRDEAPRISRPTILHPRKLGRDMHLLSDPETAFAVLALFHPRVFDIHEQHVISTVPALHPLASHPEANALHLRDLPGSIAIAEKLGMLSRHPKLFLADVGEAGHWVPFPYVGDLLPFLRDDEGPYCVNWTIKANSEAFKTKGLAGMRRRSVQPQADDLRHQLEAEHFDAAKVPTHQLSLPQLPTDLVRNLRKLHAWDARTYRIEEFTRRSVTNEMRSIVGTQKVAFHVMQELGKRHKCSVEVIKAITFSAIWRREIRVDLYQPLLPDKPLRSERIDPIDQYASWFGR